MGSLQRCRPYVFARHDIASSTADSARTNDLQGRVLVTIPTALDWMIEARHDSDQAE